MREKQQGGRRLIKLHACVKTTHVVVGTRPSIERVLIQVRCEALAHLGNYATPKLFESSWTHPLVVSIAS